MEAAAARNVSAAGGGQQSSRAADDLKDLLSSGGLHGQADEAATDVGGGHVSSQACYCMLIDAALLPHNLLAVFGIVQAKRLNPFSHSKIC